MTIHGAGCCLIDDLYLPVDFSSPAFRAARSRSPGDGGLTPGKLVFAEDFERFIGMPYETALASLIGGIAPTARNLGGPSIVSLAHAAQLLAAPAAIPAVAVRYFGARGDDATGIHASSYLARLPIDSTDFIVAPLSTPRTDVLSDPAYDGGHGERSFINLVGSAANYGAEELPAHFFDADIIALGGTALVPRLHDALTVLLRRARKNGAFTFVNLVYDFRSERASPGAKWRLGAEDDAYQEIDLLVADAEEALRTSGRPNVEEAVGWFAARGVGAVVVTGGVRDFRFWSSGRRFARPSVSSLPVSRAIDEDLRANPKLRGDTTGCGDNFAGGLMFSVAEQLRADPGALAAGRLDLVEACVWAAVSGGFACFTVGGAYYEKAPGEKRRALEPYVERYRRQISGLGHGAASRADAAADGATPGTVR